MLLRIPSITERVQADHRVTIDESVTLSLRHHLNDHEQWQPTFCLWKSIQRFLYKISVEYTSYHVQSLERNLRAPPPSVLKLRICYVFGEKGGGQAFLLSCRVSNCSIYRANIGAMWRYFGCILVESPEKRTNSHLLWWWLRLSKLCILASYGENCLFYSH